MIKNGSPAAAIFLCITLTLFLLDTVRETMYHLIGRILLLSGMILTISLLYLPDGYGVPPLPETIPSKRLYQLTPPEIDSLIQKVIQAHPTRVENIDTYSRLALGTPYALGCLGEGTEGSYDKDSLMDFSRVDCLTFCEQILALAISKDYSDTFQNLQKIRYHNGTISFQARNHFVIADWITHNQWLLRNVTQERCGSLCKEMVKTIDRRSFAAAQGCPDTNGFPPPQTMSIHYLPKQHLLSSAPEFKGGEIMLLITTREGIFASHLGFVLKRDDGSLVFRHASSIHNKVIDEPFNQLCGRIMKDQQIVGSVLLAVRNDHSMSPVPVTGTPQ